MGHVRPMHDLVHIYGGRGMKWFLEGMRSIPWYWQAGLKMRVICGCGIVVLKGEIYRMQLL